MNTREILDMLPPAPAGVERWIRKEVVQNSYIIYSKKKNEAVCTRCGHRFRADRFDMKHGYRGICPKCKAESTYKSEGIGRGKLKEYFRILLFTHKGNTVYGTLHEIIADFALPGPPRLKRGMTAVYIFSRDRQEYYGSDYYYDIWGQVKNIRLPRSPRGIYGTEARFERTVVYENNLENVFTKSCLKYLWIPELFRNEGFTAYDYIRYMALGLKYVSIELLAKSGFTTLAADKVKGYIGSGAVNWRGRSLPKIMRLSMGEIRKLPRSTLTFQELETYRSLSTENRKLPWSIISDMARRSHYEIQRIKDTGTVDFVTWSKMSEGMISVYDWCDYIKDCKSLGLDIRKKRVLFPEDFQRAHMELSDKVRVIEDEKKNDGIRKTAEFFGMDVSSDLFTLRMPETQTDLNNESSVLSHCVRTYGDKVSRGDTVIYFIRRKEDPEEPFYTLEIKPDGKFVQCRGKYNCSMTEDVKTFVEKVVKEFNMLIKKKAREAA